MRDFATIPLLLIAAFAGQSAAAQPPIDFNRDIRPILSNNCLTCHGPDEAQRQGGLRLDVRDSAMGEADSGQRAVVPGDPEASELIARIHSDDEFARMPPPETGKQLSPRDKQQLAEWIRQGAPYAVHWSYAQPQRLPLPDLNAILAEAGVADPAPLRTWPRNEVDHFILARMLREGLQPSAEADRSALIRRVSLDLTGLPPALEDVDRFVSDPDPRAYEKLVDRLLDKPASGEHWARLWLDLARYADSAGYADDPPRTIWAYRDWVIRALNENMPFDQFTIEQLAGDLLPDPTEDQLIATAFHRNTLTNNEGGTNDEEFRNVAIVDRVNTTMAVWMGTTINCCQCHNHKYDPISQEEFYQLFAILNNTEDADRRDESPLIELVTGEQKRQRRQWELEIAALEAELAAPTQDAPPDAPPIGRFIRIEIPGKQKILSLAEVQVFRGAENVALQGAAAQSSTDFNGPPKLAIDGNTSGDYNAGSVTHTAISDDPWWEVDLKTAQPIDRLVIFNRTDGTVGARLSNFRVTVLDGDRKTIWETAVAEAPNPSRELAVSRLQSQRERLAELKQQLANSKPATSVPVMRELPEDRRRKTFVHNRGNYLDLGQEVTAGLPSAFPAPPAGQPLNRLALARWLVAPENPLTARVVANRYWEALFGRGIVATSEEFGSQGDPPTHPQLLDWLATELVRLKWDRKAFLRLLVTSAAYRQTSRVSEAALQADPDNRWLSRGPRFRLSAEMVRDQALALSGLLSATMYGPPVNPPQPSLGLSAAFGSGIDWKTSEGEDRHRRAIYTTWRRSNPYPSMVTFDAPNREVCTIRRDRTNTPLQALVTLNDPVYVEAAQALARRLSAAGSSPADKAAFGFRLCVARPPNGAELDQLVALHERARQAYAADAEAARKMATVPLGPADDGADLADLAAWTVVANVLLNLDEMLMKR